MGRDGGDATLETEENEFFGNGKTIVLEFFIHLITIKVLHL